MRQGEGRGQDLLFAFAASLRSLLLVNVVVAYGFDAVKRAHVQLMRVVEGRGRYLEVHSARSQVASSFPLG